MTSAISVKEAVARVSEHVNRRPLLVCTDFDGTLSTIVMDPWAAAILPLARIALRRLAAMPDVSVVVLSGRTAWDVAERVRVGNVTYLGNHGMERGYLARRGRPEKLDVTVVGVSEAETALAARLADEVAAAHWATLADRRAQATDGRVSLPPGTGCRSCWRVGASGRRRARS